MFDVEDTSAMRTYGIFELLGVFSVAPAQAQSDTSKVEAYGGYDYIRFNINANVSGVPPAESINLNGGSGQLEYNASNKLGIVSDLGGYYGSTAGGGRGGAFSYLFGPRLNLRGDKFTTFAQLLAGGFLSTFWNRQSRTAESLRAVRRRRTGL